MTDGAGEQETAWRDYGPPVLGALIILAILVGGWYLWRTRVQEEPSPTPEEVTEVVEPSPLPSPQASPAAEVDQLPEAGFPLAPAAVASLAALALGWKLRKL